jgi:hypothetical protein
MYGNVFLLPQLFQAVHGQGPFGVGLRLLPWTATLLVVAPIAGSLVNRLGERRLIVVGLLARPSGWRGSGGSLRPISPTSGSSPR